MVTLCRVRSSSLIFMDFRLPLRIGLIGCGAAMQHLYYQPLRRLVRRRWITVEALVEPNEARQSWAKKAFPGALLGQDAATVLNQARVDLTIITSPPPLHADHARIAINLGSHVLCEKPLSDTVAAGAEMVGQAVSNGRLLCVGMTRRFYPCLAAARRYLLEGLLGRVVSYSYREGNVYGWPITSAGAFRRVTSGGGVLLDKGVHVLDLLGWIFGPGSFISSFDDSWHEGVESNSLINLSHLEVSGQIQLSWDQELNNVFTIRGDNGELMIPIGPLHDLFFRRNGFDWQRIPADSQWPSDLDFNGRNQGQPKTYYDCIDYQLVQMLRALAYEEPVPVSGDEGLVTLQLIQSAYDHTMSLPQQWLPPAEQQILLQRHWNSRR